MDTAIFITTRIGSTRLENKAMLRIGGETTTEILIHRMKKVGLPIFLVTPTTDEDKRLIGMIAKRNKVKHFMGDNTNIIQRHYQCALKNKIDFIINIDGDDILACPEVVENLYGVADHCLPDCIYTKGLPLGLNVMGYKRSAIERIYFNNDTGWGSQIIHSCDPKIINYDGFGDFRLTLDYDEDLQVISRIIEAREDANLVDICNYIEKENLNDINSFRSKEYWTRFQERMNT